ncbi:hypothetical protein BBIA_1849 [Bifidobacterium biavatii DSM 23969]|uniref:HTH cro/C1-type domain-containing protein n=2 Tax=Bifidobacterium biavatii TaxID=762212 RepID=A0A086ZTS7_9BIFI|nr:hypothetical protein BBIA_1849 [Bifidobacterium biavatii DSM 23969]
MERLFSNNTASQLDSLVKSFTIEDMEKISTTLTAGQIAIETIARLAGAKGVTRETLAKQLGITRQTVTSRFRTRSMSLDDYIDTCRALDLNPAEILDRATKLATPTLPAVIKEALQGDRPFAVF